VILFKAAVKIAGCRDGKTEVKKRSQPGCRVRLHVKQTSHYLFASSSYTPNRKNQSKKQVVVQFEIRAPMNIGPEFQTDPLPILEMFEMCQLPLAWTLRIAVGDN
jgi:hypothetical protein